MSHINIASSNRCSTCGGEVDGFKCPECGVSSVSFDHDHFHSCTKGGKMKLKCKACGHSEPHCTC